MASMNCRDRKIPKAAAAPGMMTAQNVPKRSSFRTIRNCEMMIACVGIIIVARRARNSGVLSGKLSLANA